MRTNWQLNGHISDWLDFFKTPNKMQIIHNLGILTVKKDTDENAGFLLTNKEGSYCSFFNKTSSRYQGLFYFDDSSMKMYKFIESIDIKDSGNITCLKNGFYFIERVRGSISELFFMPKGFNSLVYELDTNREIDLVLDCKDSYDNREWGRNYEIFDEDTCTVVKFTKKTNKREDNNDAEEEFVLYLAIKSNGSLISKNDMWIERHYCLDEQRNSQPFKRYVYNALKLKGSKFVFSISKNKREAMKECGCIFDYSEELKHKEKENFFAMLKEGCVKKLLSKETINSDIKVAYINSINSLGNLCINTKKCAGVLAGLPWFFQFWSRDALISLKSLSKFNKKLADRMLSDYLSKINENGRLNNLIGQHTSSKLGCADAHGWLFLRCAEAINKIISSKETIKSIKASIKLLKFEIESALDKSIHRLMKRNTIDNFEVNDSLETWMDTDYEKDSRDGARIEMQAFRLNIYKLMHELTLNQRYAALGNLLRLKTREKFWSGRILADGLNDFTIRPNIFIAAYAYRDLLSDKEWEICFENSLKDLWLEWGGLSTISKNSPLFTDESTGEDIKSYHRGDSWFWLNNLAAIMLNRINKNKFKKNISKIIEASAEEILWNGCIGCHSELSSAKELGSEGCFNQAWSNAMFIEMVDEIFECENRSIED